MEINENQIFFQGIYSNLTPCIYCPEILFQYYFNEYFNEFRFKISQLYV